jgi:hypothetical protein
VLCKALDVISGNCAYRKYLHKCSENGEKWAVEVRKFVIPFSNIPSRPTPIWANSRNIFPYRSPPTWQSSPQPSKSCTASWTG